MQPLPLRMLSSKYAYQFCFCHLGLLFLSGKGGLEVNLYFGQPCTQLKLGDSVTEEKRGGWILGDN